MDEVDVLVELIKAYSPTEKEEPGVRIFTKIAESIGMTTEIDGAGNGIARLGSGSPQTMFLGHIDTVEGELPIRVEDNVVHGRGAVDAKGPLTAGLVAASRYFGKGEVVVVACVGEEKDSRGARFLIPRYKPDYLIVGEPSGVANVTIGYKGSLSLLFTFEGHRRHLSHPEPSTVEVAIDFIQKLRAFCDARRGETPFMSLTAKVHGMNSARSHGKEIVRVAVNVRVPPHIQTDEVLSFLDDNGLSGKYEVRDRSEAVEVDRDNLVVRALLDAIRGTGGRPTLLRKGGTSDLNLAFPVWNIPAAVYGPGDAHLDHTNDESLKAEELRTSIKVLQRTFEVLAAA